MPARLSWVEQQSEDFTGDGKADILIRNSSTGFWFLSAMDGKTLVPANSGVIGLPSSLSWVTQ